MAAIAKLPVVIDVNGKATTPSATPVHEENFSAEDIKSPVRLAGQLTRMQKAMHDSTLAARSDPRADHRVFEGVACGVGGARVLVRHSFGCGVRWSVVGWSGNGIATGPALVCDKDDTGVSGNPQTTPDILALRSYAAGTADIEVWRARR